MSQRSRQIHRLRLGGLILALLVLAQGCGPTDATLPDELAGYPVGAHPQEAGSAIPVGARQDCIRPADDLYQCIITASHPGGFTDVRLVNRDGRLHLVAALLAPGWRRVSIDTLLADLTERFRVPPEPLFRTPDRLQAVWQDIDAQRSFRLLCYLDSPNRECIQELRNETWDAFVARERAQIAALEADVDSAEAGLVPTVNPLQMWRLAQPRDLRISPIERPTVDLLGHSIHLDRVTADRPVHGFAWGRARYLIVDPGGYHLMLFVRCPERVEQGQVLSLTGTLRSGQEAYAPPPRRRQRPRHLARRRTLRPRRGLNPGPVRREPRQKGLYSRGA